VSRLKNSLTTRLESNFPIPAKHLLLGLAIREVLAPWTGHPYDFEIWVRLGYYMQNLTNPYTDLGFVKDLSFSPYAITGSISYPPFSAFIFALTYRLYFLLGEPSRFLYYFLLKQPMVLADIGSALVLAKVILTTGDVKSAKLSSLVWIYFPFGIIVSSVWGQLDPLTLFLTLLAIFYFLTSKWSSSAVMLGLSIYMKTLPLIFLPVFLMKQPTNNRLRARYALLSLAIPVLGTLAPALAFNWGYQGLYNNFSFQVVIPSNGAMSALNIIYLSLHPSSLTHYIIGGIWIPVLLVSYLYTRKRQLGLVQGLIVSVLSFSISRPFLPEQWSLYPLAFLLLVQTTDNWEHFVALAISSTAFLIANNTLLVRFFTPVSVAAFNWDNFINNQSPFVNLRTIVMSLLALLYFTEALLTITGRKSVLYRAMAFLRLELSFRKLRIPLAEVRSP